MTAREIALLGAPVAVLLSTLMVFHFAGRWFGSRWGYLVGFAAYWSVWCIGLPWWVLGTSGVATLFRMGTPPLGHPATWNVVLLGAPLFLGYGYAFPRNAKGADFTVYVSSAALAVVNATLEELLWRGCYITLFHDSRLLGVVLPAAGFGMWHLSPQLLRPNRAPGGKLSFVAVATVIGLMWGWVAYSASSILLTSIVHALFDFSGLGARAFFQSADPPRD